MVLIRTLELSCSDTYLGYICGYSFLKTNVLFVLLLQALLIKADWHFICELTTCTFFSAADLLSELGSALSESYSRELVMESAPPTSVPFLFWCYLQQRKLS